MPATREPVSVSGAQRLQLEEQGYVVLRDYMPPALLAEMRQQVDSLLAAEGAQAGAEFKQEKGALRLANLVDKGEVFRQAIQLPELLALVEAVLGPAFKLSSLNMRAAQPHSGGSQPLHADMGVLPDETGYAVCNAVWMLDDFTAENGAIRVVPGSHQWGRLPQEVLSDLYASHPNEQLVTGSAGTVVVMNAHAWHGGTANTTSQPRRALHSFFVRRDLPQQQYQKKLLRPQTQAALLPALRHLLALDDLWNDRVSAQGAGKSGFLA